MTIAEHKEWTFTIEGMTCDHCARTIDAAVRRIPGVVGVQTNHETATSRIVSEHVVDEPALAGAISGNGFTIVRHVVKVADRKRAKPDSDELDLLILGAGSAGFAAAIRAAELGASVAIVERGALGGTCVNVGCVPSKTLIRAAEVHHRAGHHGFSGIRTARERPDFRAVIEQKRKLVAELQQAKYRDVLAAYPSIELLRGGARFRADGTVEIDGCAVPARKILLSLGARPWAPPIPGLASTPHLSSTELMELESLPEHLVVIGAGAVGLELAQMFARLGAKVTVLEALPRIMAGEDAEVSDALAGYLREEGLDVRTGIQVVEVAGAPGSYQVVVENDGHRDTIRGDQLFVATGRRPNTQGLGLEDAGIQLGKRGEIVVNEHLETTRAGLYAAGDVIGDPAFVYVAAYAGQLAADNALGTSARTYDLSVVPRVTFTDPAIASVGLTEAEARAQGIAVVTSKLPMSHVPRAIAARDTRGFVKLIADENTKLLLGAHILAPEAGDIIGQAVMAMRFGIRVDQIASLFHPYLTNAEALKLACQTFQKDVAKLSCCAA
jgi:mercuric reductase